MALTTLQGVIDGITQPVDVHKNLGTAANMQGRWFTHWYTTLGTPVGPGGAGAATPGTALTAPQTGQVPFTNPTSGETLLARFGMAPSPNNGEFLLVDRLWHMSGLVITSTSPQTVSSATWPARDINQSTNGEGVYIALQISAAVGAGTPSLSMTYTNSAGTGSKVGANVMATVASAILGGVWVMGLAAGDTGVRSMQDFTLSSSWTSGSISLVAFRPIAHIPGGTQGAPTRLRRRIEDALSLGAPRIWNDSVLELWTVLVQSGAGTNPGGSMTFSQG